MPRITDTGDYDEYNEPGLYMIYNQDSGTVLDLYNGSGAAGTPIQGWRSGEDSKNDHQKWQIADVGRSKLILINRGTGSLASCPDDGEKVVSAVGFPDKHAVHWKVAKDPRDPKIVRFLSVAYQGDCMELKNGDSSDGAAIRCTGANDDHNGQKWMLKKLSSN